MSRQAADFWDEVRASIVGATTEITTPFGPRRMMYADYTASGRAVGFIERYLQRLLALYGNTHTEDDTTGIATTARLVAAEQTIKRLVHADEKYKLVMVGSGSTGAVHRLQQILGLYLPPAGKEMFREQLSDYFSRAEYDAFLTHFTSRRPIVFVGPYEHHSNEISWRECWAEVVEIDLTPDGLLDLDDLERKVADPAYAERFRIGAFSAASNVSGLKTPVYDVARVLHRHGALAFFDFAAIAPYVDINVHLDDEAYFDAVYFSPHKFLGGPGSSGVLIFHQDIYRADLPPTMSGGGTVNYVWSDGQDYSSDIEVREKAGTPGILQTMRAALAMELKERMDPERIARREDELLARGLTTLSSHPAVEIIGPTDVSVRIAILSFNIRVDKSFLHPRFVTVLLNDLFGIQSRAGCSCAGPYGHRLLHLDAHQSRVLRERIARGDIGLRPGWVRVNFHFLMTDDEFDYLCRAILFVAEHGRFFLPLYTFDVHTGGWMPASGEGAMPRSRPEEFGLAAALDAAGTGADEADSRQMTPEELHAAREGYLAEAAQLAAGLREKHASLVLKTTERDLIPFVYA
jgi:selenocysteine lyase/cysteine desulfurase